MGPVGRLLPDGRRLHLQHGPIDLVIGADGERALAFEAAQERFETVLEELVDELAMLRMPLDASTAMPLGAVALRMHNAALPLCDGIYLTRMAAVAGAVADEILAAMVADALVERAYVNNGGDIALHLSAGTSFTTVMQGHDGRNLGRISVRAEDPVRGIATSGRHGRSLSLGIADSVTVLAPNAAAADVAATLIGNAVDLSGNPAIVRRPANTVAEDSDLAQTPVVVGCGLLSDQDCNAALCAGQDRALGYQSLGLIHAAALYLQGQSKTTSESLAPLQSTELLYA